MSKANRKVKSTKISFQTDVYWKRRSAFLQKDDIFQSSRFRTWEQVGMCLMLLNQNCLYTFRAVPFASLLQGGVYLLSQLVEEWCFLASPFPKAKIKPTACEMKKARPCLSPDDCKETQRNWRNVRLVQQQQDCNALQFDYLKAWNFDSWSSRPYSGKKRLKIVSIFLDKMDLSK